MNGAFTGQILAEKLAKLNSSRQSIETLSHWCIFHRKKAKQVVQTWEREFHSVTREQRVPFLYLANDILQNSRRKGGEFVTEFWKVLSGALRDVVEHGDDSGRNAVYRLVDIWEERRVFGSRGRSLREELLGKGPLSPVRENVEREKPPATSPKIVLPSVILEKISGAYQSVQEGQAEEDEALQNCNYAIRQVESLEKEAENRSSSGQSQDSIADDLQEQQTVLAHCIEQLESSEMTRGTLVQQLKDALHEQETKLEHLRTQLQIAQAQAEQAGSVRQRLLTGSPSLSELSPIGRENGLSGRDSSVSHHPDVPSMSDKDNSMPRVGVTGSLPPSTGSLVMERVAPLDDNNNKSQKNLRATSTAAEVAAKLAANTSSAAMLSSVLSSLAAEEANSGGRLAGSIPLDVPALGRPLDKRQRLDGRPDGSEVLSYNNMSAQMSPLQSAHQQQQPPIPQPPPMGQYVGGGQMLQYGYALPPPPPPPMQGHPMMAMQRMGGHPQPLPPPGMGGPPFQQLQPPNLGYYNSPPMPAPPAPMRPQ